MVATKEEIITTAGLVGANFKKSAKKEAIAYAVVDTIFCRCLHHRWRSEVLLIHRAGKRRKILAPNKQEKLNSTKKQKTFCSLTATL